MQAGPRIYDSFDALDRELGRAAAASPAIEVSGNAVLIVGGSLEQRIAAALSTIRPLFDGSGETVVWADPDPGEWPWRSDLTGHLPGRGHPVIWVNDIDLAFPSHQTGGTRLVLTQSTYLLQKWVDALERQGRFNIILTADERALVRGARDAFGRRGPWSRFEIVHAGDPQPLGGAAVETAEEASSTHHEPALDVADARALVRWAFTTPSPLDRLDACRRAATLDQAWPLAWLALASACMEQQQFDEAGAALDRAAALAPESEAVHFERGKLWLRFDDMERAGEAFARAGELMPTLSAAFSNLGATLGELDRPEEAVDAFNQALKHDPESFTILNNIGVVSRELGRLDASEKALRRVIELAPDFIFGHYNLGHTLFLQGRFSDARDAYVEGQRRDPERNARQACRLAMCRLASNDPIGALRDLDACTTGQPREVRVDLLSHAQEILVALLAARPDLPGGPEMASRIEKETGANR